MEPEHPICDDYNCGQCAVCNPPCPYCGEHTCPDAAACLSRREQGRMLAHAMAADQEKCFRKRWEAGSWDDPPF